MTRTLVLGGGAALGAFHGGAIEALDAAGFEPDHVVGTSIGAVAAVLYAGNPPHARVDALRGFWNEVARGDGAAGAGPARRRRNLSDAWTTILFGRSPLFAPRFPGPLAALPLLSDVALHQSTQFEATLLRYCDLDRLGDGPRVTILAVDVESGEVVEFDSERVAITPRHLRAATALPIFFPPVDLDGRALVDAGVAQNLPLDPALRDASGDVDLLAFDLYEPRGPRPGDFNDAAERAQDLLFGLQSRRSVERWRAEFAARDGVQARMVLATRSDPARESGGKPFDLSRASIDDRWEAGHEAARAALAQLEATPRRAGLHVIELCGTATARRA
jgi:NTE family protein